MFQSVFACTRKPERFLSAKQVGTLRGRVGEPMGKTIEDVCGEVDVGKSKSEQSLPKRSGISLLVRAANRPSFWSVRELMTHKFCC